MNVAHIVPSMNVGGVEMAICRTSTALNEVFDYKVYCVKSQGSLVAGQHKLRDYFKNLICSSSRADVVVTSLWWSHPIGLVSVLFGVRWVVFLHSSGFASFPDWLVTRIALLFAKNFFYDSDKTREQMLKGSCDSTYFIPCFTLNSEALPEFNEETAADLIWVGRNSPEKRLDLVVDVLRALLLARPSTSISLYVAGAQFAEFEELQSEFKAVVNLRYNVAPVAVLDALQDSKIALCLSDYEGFSMSTAEAAFFGNVIAAREVGDLHSYLPERETLWLRDLEQASLDHFVLQLQRLLDDEPALTMRRKRTMKFAATKLSRLSYVPALVSAINTVLGAGHE